MDAIYSHEGYFYLTSSRGQFKLKGIIIFVPVPECFTSSSQLHCGRPRGDSEIPVLPPNEIQKDNYITFMQLSIILCVSV